MGIYKCPPAFSITCDKCGEGFDTMGEAWTISEQVEQLRESGWKGNRKYILCPECVPVHPPGEPTNNHKIHRAQM